MFFSSLPSSCLGYRSQRLFQVLESGSASVQSQITESCFNSAAVLLHSIIAALLSNLETFKAYVLSIHDVFGQLAGGGGGCNWLSSCLSQQF